ncbi:hypothetical protein [Thauera humireducens]|uniref:hypothetical protein n=1 Tax=Thauera humireducens TaxID=1134435 RepID=UPI00311D6863
MAVGPDSPDLRSNFNRLRGETGEEELLGIGSHGLTRNGRTLTSCALRDDAANANHFVMSAEKLGIRGDFEPPKDQDVNTNQLM